MNCNDIHRVLDTHRLAGLSRAERTQLDTHVAGCAACFDAVGVHEALAGEKIPGPRAGLMQGILAKLVTDTGTGPVRPAHRWRPLTGLAAALLLVVSLVWLAQGPEGESAGTTMNRDASRQPEPAELPVAAFVEGEHYLSMPLASPLSDLGDRVSAWIFFMWSCLHCYELEAILPEWIAEHDDDEIEVIRVPVQWNAVARLHARAFYTAELLGLAEPINRVFFREIHRNGNRLETRDEIEAVFREAGIDSDAFAAVFESSEVEANLQTALRLADRYEIDATPTLVIAGAYKTNPGMAGSHERMLRIADWLFVRDRQPGSRFCDLNRVPCQPTLE